MATQLLVVDDEPGIRAALELLFEERGGFEVTTAASGREGLHLISSRSFDLMLCDVAMPGMDGLAVLEEARRRQPDLQVVMISAHGEVDLAVRAVRGGAYDYLLKPIDETRLFQTIEKALELRRLHADYQTLKEAGREEWLLLGESQVVQKLREDIALAAPTDARVLILGENGTGKEVVARRIHEESRRAARAFVKLNSAALPKDLVESELFGHEAGAFTGATKLRKGKFEQADGGTLFLDEIGDMAPDTQAKLLRVLSTGEVERVGGATSIQVDVRLLSASNRDLWAGVQNGGFREDLYHRLAVIPLRVPPLRERGEDIELLAEHFLAAHCAGLGRAVPALTPSARRLLVAYPWPGNVRELRNVMERVTILHRRDELDADALEGFLTPIRPTAESSHRPEEGGGESQGAHPSRDSVQDWKAKRSSDERALVLQCLNDAGWNVTLAAERLGLDRASLHRKMNRMGIVRPGRSAS